MLHPVGRRDGGSPGAGRGLRAAGEPDAPAWTGGRRPPGGHLPRRPPGERAAPTYDAAPADPPFAADAPFPAADAAARTPPPPPSPRPARNTPPGPRPALALRPASVWDPRRVPGPRDGTPAAQPPASPR